MHHAVPSLEADLTNKVGISIAALKLLPHLLRSITMSMLVVSRFTRSRHDSKGIRRSENLSNIGDESHITRLN